LHVDSVEKVAVRFSHRRQKIRLLRSACKPLEDSYPAAAIPVLIRSVTVHELVDRPQTVVHAGANHVAVEKFARWADPLTSQIPRVFAAGVAQILNSPRVSAYPICGVQGAAYRMQLDVQRFDVTHGEVATVDVLWSVSPPGKGLPLTGRARRARALFRLRLRCASGGQQSVRRHRWPRYRRRDPPRTVAFKRRSANESASELSTGACCMTKLLIDVVIFLASALIVVPLSVRLGFGAVLGYLVAGVMIGPWVLGLVTDVDAILHFSELGIVLMMFVIGLEMRVDTLWAMRRTIFGYGAMQMATCAAVLAAVFLTFGTPWRVALTGGLALALSSTAMVIAELQERRLMDMPTGRAGFGILLFQDMAAIPLIALLPLLGPTAGNPAGQPSWLLAAKALVMLIAVVLTGRYLLHFALRLISRTGVREIFTAFALLWVIGIALLMERVHLSMSLGAFVAGVLLADSEFRHEIEIDMAPFKGLLLGLFFIAVGMSIDFGVLVREPIRVAALVVALVSIKSIAQWFLANRFEVPASQRAYFAILLSQGGEFAFVVLAASLAARVIDQRLSSLVTLVVALSMVSTPLLLLAHLRFWQPRIGKGPDATSRH
jgi:glutathione-regulated potassium-efflux system ancillary protein KefC